MKCAYCSEQFKKKEEIIYTEIIGSGKRVFVHSECHYGFLCESISYDFVSYEEMKEECKVND